MITFLIILCDEILFVSSKKRGNHYYVLILTESYKGLSGCLHYFVILLCVWFLVNHFSEMAGWNIIKFLVDVVKIICKWVTGVFFGNLIFLLVVPPVILLLVLLVLRIMGQLYFAYALQMQIAKIYLNKFMCHLCIFIAVVVIMPYS